MKNDDEAGDQRKGVQSVEHAARLLEALIKAGAAAPEPAFASPIRDEEGAAFGDDRGKGTNIEHDHRAIFVADR